MAWKKKSYVLIGLLCGIVFLLLAYIGVQNASLTQSVQTLEENWSFSRNGERESVQPEAPLSAYIFPEVLKGDVVTLSRKFYESNSPNRMIAFDTWHSITNVYLDQQQIYTWGEEYAEKEQMLGSVRHNICLPEEYAGKTLTIEIEATENNPMPYLTSVAFYQADNPAVFWFNRPVSLLLLGAFFIILGLFLIFVACIFVEDKSVSLEKLMLGICIVLTGVYILSRGNFIQLLIPNPLIYNAIEYISLFMVPVPILFYWQQDALACKSKVVRIGYIICATLNCLFVICSLLLNFMTPIHLCQLLPLFYVIVFFVTVIIFILIGFRNKAEGAAQRKIYILGMCSFITGSILSIVAFRLCYNVLIADLLQLWKWYNFILPFSMCILVLFFTMAFFLDMKQILENNYRHEFLHYISYSDPLTKLYNRRSFDEDMDRLCNKPNDNAYGIISIDLNDLKKVNDLLGHTVGDLMLESFAGLLADTCSGHTKAYRLGGDEFAVVVTENPETECIKIIDYLQSAIENFNTGEQPFILSAAYGTADNRDAQTPELVFELADKRMYQKKREMKS